VHAAAQSIGVSERRMQQLFQAHVGLSPRGWRRLARIHDCVHVLRQGEPASWAALAADCGFSDQPHLINEFRAICGLTPTQFLRRSVSGSSNTSA
jgi:AraC-like DNA-binding protein